MRHGVNDYTKDGKCTGCGQCCSNFLPLSTKEVKEIWRYVEKHHIRECRHFAPTAKPIDDWTCPFLDDTRRSDKCTIYEVRPEICREFQCNRDPQEMGWNKDLLWRKRTPVNMREMFFGGGADK